MVRVGFTGEEADEAEEGKLGRRDGPTRAGRAAKQDSEGMIVYRVMLANLNLHRRAEANAKDARMHGREGLSPGFDDDDPGHEVSPPGIIGVFFRLSGSRD